MEELQKFMDKHRQWADATFGTDRKASAPIHHLLKEVKELIEAIENNEPRENVKFEFADCMILLLHGASMNDLPAKELFEYVEKKFAIAQTRKWGKLDENGVALHIKE
jgi:NTP pyrophosphatase (non-canonical NTP hydrolase)